MFTETPEQTEQRVEAVTSEVKGLVKPEWDASRKLFDRVPVWQGKEPSILVTRPHGSDKKQEANPRFRGIRYTFDSKSLEFAEDNYGGRSGAHAEVDFKTNRILSANTDVGFGYDPRDKESLRKHLYARKGVVMLKRDLLAALEMAGFEDARGKVEYQYDKWFSGHDEAWFKENFAKEWSLFCEQVLEKE